LLAVGTLWTRIEEAVIDYAIATLDEFKHTIRAFALNHNFVGRPFGKAKRNEEVMLSSV
jgi:hypothetical protein